MLHHRTTDKVKRAEHIADRLERNHEEELSCSGLNPYQDWPRYWLKQYSQIVMEFENENDERTEAF
jgi:hypothetical protein